VVVGGTDVRLDVTMGLPPIKPDLVVIVDPGFAYRQADAVVRLRIVDRVGVEVKGGYATIVPHAIIQEVFKRLPADPIALGNTASIQWNAGAAEAGDEFVALLDTGCPGTWRLGFAFKVENGRVAIPTGRRGYSAEWNRFDSALVDDFIDALKALRPPQN